MCVGSPFAKQATIHPFINASSFIGLGAFHHIRFAGWLQTRIEGEQAWRNAASKADADSEVLRQQLRNVQQEVETVRQQMNRQNESDRESATSRENALKLTLDELKAGHEKEMAALREELSSNGEWWRGRVDAVREEEEAVSDRS